MLAIKYITKGLALAAIVAVVFGPFGVLQQIQAPVAQAATCDATTPGATYIPNTVNGGGYYTCPNGTVTNGTTGQSKQGPADNSCNGITSCLASMVYYIGPGFASWVASWAAYFFDFIVRMSLDSGMYALGFLSTSWGLVLSLANMFFIFILIYAAFTIMFRAETARTMQMLAWVITIALLVNFSFFFTRVVVDAGNIIGVQFYNAVALSPGVTPINAGSSGSLAVPDITKPLAKAISVDQLLGGQSFNTVTTALGSNGNGSVFSAASWETLLVFTVVFLFAAVMWWILAIALLMVGLKFFLRVIGLWLVLVASPLAFVAQTVGSTRKFFQQWLRTLVGLSMYPAVFLFMFWVLDQFAVQLGGGLQLLGISNNTASQLNASQAQADPTSLIVLIANVSIRMMFIIVLLYIILKVSDWVIEQAGGMTTTLINRGSAAILGGGFRTAAWAGALAGRNTIGRGAYAAAQSAGFKNAAANSRIGSALWRGTSALSRGTFDARNAPGAQGAGGLLGRLSRTSDVSTGRGSQRSFSQSVDDKAQRLTRQAEALKASPTEAFDKQRKFEAEFERKNGAGSFTAKVAELQKQQTDATKLAEENRRAGMLDPAQAAHYQGLQKIQEAAAKKATEELKALTVEGKRTAQVDAKSRIAAFADRLDKRGKEKVLNVPYQQLEPVSHGAIAAAAAIREMNEPKKEKKAKESAAPAPAPAAPAAAAAAASAEAAHANGEMLKVLGQIRKAVEKGNEQHKEGFSHMAETFHDSAARMERGFSRTVQKMHAMNDNHPTPTGGGTPPPRAANDNIRPPKPANDNFEVVQPRLLGNQEQKAA